MIDYYGNEISWVPVIEKTEKPVYISLAECIEKDIASGKLPIGFRLPPQRIIAGYLGFNHSTVTKAYKICEEKGLVKGVVGKGTFVSSTSCIPSEVMAQYKDESMIEMGMVLPVYETNEYCKNLIHEVTDLIDFDLVLKYAPPEGSFKHRYIASEWLKQYRIKARPEQIVITSGNQNALSVILVSLFDKGDRIAVDEFTYTGVKNLAKLLGIILIPVKGNNKGMDLQELRNVCKRDNVKGLYLIPDCHNPTSVIMDLQTRKEISEIIEQFNILLIEDGTFSYCLEDKIMPIFTLNPEYTIYIQGTAKALNPTFRISYMVSPIRFLERFKNGINTLNWMASPYSAEILSILQASSKYDDLVKVKIEKLKIRNKIMDSILKEFGLYPSKTAPFRYLSLSEDMDDVLIEKKCYHAGVHVFSLKRFSVGTNKVQSGIRISGSGPKTIKELENGLITLRDVIKSYRK